MTTITRVGSVRCRMGEGPLWDVAEQALYFVDVFGKRLWRHDPARGDMDGWDMPCRISSLALRTDGGAIMALETGIALFEFVGCAHTPIGDPTAGRPRIFLNDGKADARGRFVVGAVEAAGAPEAGLFSVGTDGTIRQLDDGFGITNGPCWSPDGKILYLADSAAQTIYAYDYDVDTGTVADRRRFADTGALGGIPDGATVDDRGRLWTAICDGAAIACFDSDGSLARTIDFPTGFVSSVMFGGPELDRLYVTTIDAATLIEVAAASGARHGPDALGGALFVVDGLGARGLPEHRYGEPIGG